MHSVQAYNNVNTFDSIYFQCVETFLSACTQFDIYMPFDQWSYVHPSDTFYFKMWIFVNWITFNTENSIICVTKKTIAFLQGP